MPIFTPVHRTSKFSTLFEWPQDSVIFGLTGQLNPDKGQEDFIDAAATVLQTHPNARFVIGGKPEGPYYDSLLRRVDALHINHAVAFSGWLPVVTDFFEATDVVVLASRHEEGFGLVLAQAGERSLPVVATKSGGAVEIVIDGQTGLLVDRQDPPALARAMSLLAESPDLRASLGTQARQRVSQNFNLQTQVAKFADFLHSCSGCPSSKP